MTVIRYILAGLIALALVAGPLQGAYHQASAGMVSNCVGMAKSSLPCPSENSKFGCEKIGCSVLSVHALMLNDRVVTAIQIEKPNYAAFIAVVRLALPPGTDPPVPRS